MDISKSPIKVVKNLHDIFEKDTKAYDIFELGTKVYNNYALRTACRNGHIEVIKYLHDILD